MSKRNYVMDLSSKTKILVGEGESDFHFFRHFCERNNIGGFETSFAGMLNPNSSPSGFDIFGDWLNTVTDLRDFENVTDIVIACDSAESHTQRFEAILKQVDKANANIAARHGVTGFYSKPMAPNQVSESGSRRIHVLLLPVDKKGGLESLCIDVLRGELDKDNGTGSKIQEHVDKFADCVCFDWTTEKRDKLRLQAFLSASFKKWPDAQFYQLFGMSSNKLIPLNSDVFEKIRTFLTEVSALS